MRRRRLRRVVAREDARQERPSRGGEGRTRIEARFPGPRRGRGPSFPSGRTPAELSRDRLRVTCVSLASFDAATRPGEYRGGGCGARLRRSRSLSPPHTPCATFNRSVKSRHSSRTGQRGAHGFGITRRLAPRREEVDLAGVVRALGELLPRRREIEIASARAGRNPGSGRDRIGPILRPRACAKKEDKGVSCLLITPRAYPQCPAPGPTREPPGPAGCRAYTFSSLRSQPTFIGRRDTARQVSDLGRFPRTPPRWVPTEAEPRPQSTRSSDATRGRGQVAIVRIRSPTNTSGCSRATVAARTPVSSSPRTAWASRPHRRSAASCAGRRASASSTRCRTTSNKVCGVAHPSANAAASCASGVAPASPPAPRTEHLATYGTCRECRAVDPLAFDERPPVLREAEFHVFVRQPAVAAVAPLRSPRVADLEGTGGRMFPIRRWSRSSRRRSQSRRPRAHRRPLSPPVAGRGILPAAAA